MQIKPVIHNQQYSAIKASQTTSNQSSTDKQTSTKTIPSNDDYVVYTQTEKEQITYNVKSLRNQATFNSANPPNQQKEDISQVELSIKVNDDELLLKNLEFHASGNNYQSIKIDQITGERQWGSLKGENNIDAFDQIRKRLNVEQNKKMSYITPSQDWLELADKLSDEELNDLVDIIYDISDSVFLENESGEEVEFIVSQLNALSEEELSSSIATMAHLRDQAEIGKNFYQRPERYGKVTDVDDFIAASPIFHYEEGDLLREYSTLMFSSELSDDERSTVNEHLLNMDYAAAGGLISSTAQVEDDSKQQLFSLLSGHETEELMEVFSYLGNLANKDTFTSQYEIEDEEGKQSLATVFDPVDGVNQKLLIESLFNVEQTSGLDTVKEFIRQTVEYTDQVQSNAWQKIAESSEESTHSLSKEDIDLLLNQASEEVTSKHHQIMTSAFKTDRPGGNMVSSTVFSEGD